MFMLDCCTWMRILNAGIEHHQCQSLTSVDFYFVCLRSQLLGNQVVCIINQHLKILIITPFVLKSR